MPKPAMAKAPSKEHPYQPETPAATIAVSAQTAAEKVFSTRLPPDLIRRLKTHAAATDTSVQDVVSAALNDYLNRA